MITPDAVHGPSTTRSVARPSNREDIVTSPRTPTAPDPAHRLVPTIGAFRPLRLLPRIVPGLLALALLPLLAGCASGTGGGSSSTGVLTMEDLEGWEGRSLGEAIQALRPRWLRSRGNTSIEFGEETVRVILDGAVIGAADQALRQIEVDVVRDARYLDAREATTRYGTGFGGGAIAVRTRGD